MVASASVMVGELLCEAIPLRAGQLVLDVATGSGNTAMSAARRATQVIGVDFVPALLERARERVAVERMKNVTFLEGDVEALPFPDRSFDVVLSTFGHIFATDQKRAALEMARVTRPGGKIGFTAWTASGTMGQIFDLWAKYDPRPAGVPSSNEWGREEFVRERFGPWAETFRFERRLRQFRALSPEQWLAFMRQHLGPAIMADAALDADGQQQLTHDFLDVITRSNESGDSTLYMPTEYLEVVVTLKR